MTRNGDPTTTGSHNSPRRVHGVAVPRFIQQVPRYEHQINSSRGMQCRLGSRDLQMKINKIKMPNTDKTCKTRHRSKPHNDERLKSCPR